LYKNLRVQPLILNDSAINRECEKLAGNGDLKFEILDLGLD
jgi:hypothetical protein